MAGAASPSAGCSPARLTQTANHCQIPVSILRTSSSVRRNRVPSATAVPATITGVMFITRTSSTISKCERTSASTWEFATNTSRRSPRNTTGSRISTSRRAFPEWRSLRPMPLVRTAASSRTDWWIPIRTTSHRALPLPGNRGRRRIFSSVPDTASTTTVPSSISFPHAWLHSRRLRNRPR